MTGEKRVAHPLVLAVGIGVFALLLGYAPFYSGALVVTQHEGDTIIITSYSIHYTKLYDRFQSAS